MGITFEEIHRTWGYCLSLFTNYYRYTGDDTYIPEMAGVLDWHARFWQQACSFFSQKNKICNSGVQDPTNMK